MPSQGDKDNDILAAHIAKEQMDWVSIQMQDAISTLLNGVPSATVTHTVTTGPITNDYVHIGDPPNQNMSVGSSSGELGTITLTPGGVDWQPIIHTGAGTSWHGSLQQEKFEVGDVWLHPNTDTIDIWDGHAWKPILTPDELEEMFEEYKLSMREEVTEITRFLRLEEDEVISLPEKIKDELLVQGFRLKVQRALKEAFKSNKDAPAK